MLRTYLTSVWSRCTQIWCVLTIFLESRYENHYLSSDPLFGKKIGYNNRIIQKNGGSTTQFSVKLT